MKRPFILAFAILLILLCGCNGEKGNEINVSSVPSYSGAAALKSDYEKAQKLHSESPEKYRDLLKLQAETTKITELGGQYYQALIKSTDKYPQGLIYIYISKEEYQSRVNEAIFWEFNWIAIGTKENFSFENIGKFKE